MRLATLNMLLPLLSGSILVSCSDSHEQAPAATNQTANSDERKATIIYASPDGTEYFAPGYFKGAPIAGRPKEQLSDGRVILKLQKTAEDDSHKLYQFTVNAKDPSKGNIEIQRMLFTVYGDQAVELQKGEFKNEPENKFTVEPEIAAGGIVRTRKNASQLNIILLYTNRIGSSFTFYDLRSLDEVAQK